MRLRKTTQSIDPPSACARALRQTKLSRHKCSALQWSAFQGQLWPTSQNQQTLIHRCNQHISGGMAKTGEIAVRTRQSMTTKSLRVRSCPSALTKAFASSFCRSMMLGPSVLPARFAQAWQSPSPDPAAAMLDIITQTALANIQINRPNPFTGVQKRGNQVHGNSGFARPALLIANDNNKRPACGAMPVVWVLHFGRCRPKLFLHF